MSLYQFVSACLCECNDYGGSKVLCATKASDVYREMAAEEDDDEMMTMIS